MRSTRYDQYINGCQRRVGLSFTLREHLPVRRSAYLTKWTKFPKCYCEQKLPLKWDSNPASISGEKITHKPQVTHPVIV